MQVVIAGTRDKLRVLQKKFWDDLGVKDVLIKQAKNENKILREKIDKICKEITEKDSFLSQYDDCFEFDKRSDSDDEKSWGIDMRSKQPSLHSFI